MNFCQFSFYSTWMCPVSMTVGGVRLNTGFVPAVAVRNCPHVMLMSSLIASCEDSGLSSEASKQPSRLIATSSQTLCVVINLSDPSLHR